MKRAAIYVRVSSERQAAEDRVSIEAQLADCETLCKERNYIVVDRYIDREKYRSRGKLVQPSGQRKDRPGYRKMLKAALAGEFDVIVAWKEDRLYRGMYAAMPFSEALDELGAKLEVELVRETFDRKMLGIKAALGKIESDNIRERMLMGRRARLEKGEVPGGNQVKYGYQKVDKRLAIQEDEAIIVREIFDWYIAGYNKMQMRRKLNAMGIPTRGGKHWSKATIEKILTTETYATGKMPTKLGDETFYIPCPPIISMEIWKQAEDVRAKNKFKARNVKRDFLCVGLVYCVCGWKCATRTSYLNIRRGFKSLTGTYTCQRYGTKPETMPPGCVSDIGSKKVDTFVWNFVKKLCEKPKVLRKAVNRKLAALEAEHGDLQAEIEYLEKQLGDVAEERQWVITLGRKKTITEKDVEKQLAELQIQEIELQKELVKHKATNAAREQAQALSEWAERYLSDIKAGIATLDVRPEKLTPEQQQDLFNELEAWRFDEKFPGDELAQIKWAILEEKRRLVRTVISRVIVEKIDGPEKRKITPIVSLDVPVNPKSLTYGDQSMAYIESFGDR